MDDYGVDKADLADPRLDTGRMDPEEELEWIDLQVRAAAIDEEMTMFDPGESPKPPDLREEAVTDREGAREVDVQRETPVVDVDFDLTLDELTDVDVV